MSYIVKNKDHTFLISFSNVTDDEFIMLATNFKQFYVQKNISSELIQEKFNDSDTRIKLSLRKIIKIIQDDEPAKDSELRVKEKELNLLLKFPIKIKNLSDMFSIDFQLKECNPAEIGELFLSGLLKTIIDQKLKTEGSEQFDISLPKASFEANFAVNTANVYDLCEMIGAKLNSKGNDKSIDQGESSNIDEDTKSSRKATKRHVELFKEFKFENLEDSQELEAKPVTTNKHPPPKKIIKPSKKNNVKF